jgi:GNAT superfamily N-acetyltransferase
LVYNFTQENFLESSASIDEVAAFLHTNLEEYGDDLTSIKKAILYVKERDGHILIVRKEDAQNGEIVGATVINKTGMNGYIPDNILVYIATSKAVRGQGVGKRIMNFVLEHVEGDIALHVDFKNEPATKLYEKLGFSKKYYEMRLIRSTK